MSPGPLDHLTHPFKFHSAEQARLNALSCYSLSPPDDDWEEIDRPEFHKGYVYEILMGIVGHVEKGGGDGEDGGEKRVDEAIDTEGDEKPSLGKSKGIDQELWKEFEEDQRSNLKVILDDERGKKYAEAERRSWGMIDEIFKVHLQGARRANVLGDPTQYVMKCSERLEGVMGGVRTHPIIAMDVLRGHNLPEIAAMTDYFVEKRVMLQYRIFCEERRRRGEGKGEGEGG